MPATKKTLMPPDFALLTTPTSRVEHALRSWPSVQKHIRYLTEKELRLAMKIEKARTRQRPDVQLRIVQRLSAIASDKIRSEFLGPLNAVEATAPRKDAGEAA